MTPEEQQELTNMANLYDSLSSTLKQVFVSQTGYMSSVKMECEITKEGFLRVPDQMGFGEVAISKELSAKLNSDPDWWKPETIQNTSNTSSYVGWLEEESKEMVKIETISNKAW